MYGCSLRSSLVRMTWSKPKNSMLKKTAFSTSGDARELRVSTKKTRPTGCCMIDVSRAGGVVTEEVRVKRRLMIPITNGVLIFGPSFV